MLRRLQRGGSGRSPSDIGQTGFAQRTGAPISPAENAPTAQDDKSDEAEVTAALAKLSDEDRKLASAQRDCVVLDNRLGSMGTPIKIMIDGKPVFLCCEGCRKKALANAKASLSRAAELKAEATKR